jgi:O-acetylserine/cysteine efflux transporter
MKPRDITLLLIINAVWGFNFVPLRISVDELSPLLSAFARMAIVALVLLTMGPWHMGSLYFAMHLMADVSVAAIVTQLSVPFSTLLGVLVLGERLGPWRLAGMVTAFTGVVILTFDPQVFSYVDGVVVMIVAQVAYAVGAISMRQVKNVGVFEMQSWVAATSLPFLAALSLMFETSQWQQLTDISWLAVGAVLYSALLSSVFGHGGIYYLYQRYPVSTVMPICLIGPVFAVTVSVLIFNETLTPRMVLGCVVIFVGVAIVTFREAMRAKAKGL